jgi:hypothetical protein
METCYIVLFLFCLWNIAAYWAVLTREEIQNLLGLSPKVVKHVKKTSRKNNRTVNKNRRTKPGPNSKRAPRRTR